MKTRLVLAATAMMTLGAGAQVESDKPIQLTGSGHDAKIAGIQKVTDPQDGANKAYVDSVVAANSAPVSNMAFTLTSNKSALTLPVGGNTRYDQATLTSAYVSGDGSPVSLRITGAPAGVTWTFSPSGGYPTFSSTLIFYASTSASPGVYPITVTASGGQANQTVSISLTVAASKRVFVTSQSFNGNLGGLSGADTKCQTAAGNASLGGTWRAWLSTGTLNSPIVNASSRVTQHNGPFIRIDGDLVAQNWADLVDGSLVNAISRDELNNAVPLATGSGADVYVWTNTRTNGAAGTETNNTNRSCSSWTNSSSSYTDASTSYRGRISSNSSWTDYDNDTCNKLQRLYCFEL
jgi:hypothetical protein